MSNSNLATFSVSRPDLVAELSLAVGVVEKRTTIPILSNVRLDASGGVLTITATDLELGMLTQIPAEVQVPGSGTLPAKRLLDYVRLLAADRVSLKFAENAWCTVSAGKSRLRMAGMSVEAFPELPTAPAPALTVPLATLATGMIRRTAYAISAEEARFTLNAALLEIDGNLRMVATDGHRLALAEAPGSGQKQSLIVPKRALVELQRLASSAAIGTDVQMAADDNHLFFTVGSRVLCARKMSGNFPDYKRVMKQPEGGTVTVATAELTEALKRVRLSADERSHCVRLAIADGALAISSRSAEVGESDETVAAEIAGPDLVAGFSAQYLLDALGGCTEKAVIRYSDAQRAITVQSAGDDSYRCVIMPMRI